MKRTPFFLAAVLTTLTTSSWADVVPTPDRSVNRSLPEDGNFKADTEYQKLYHDQLLREEAARSALRGAIGAPASGATTLAPAVTSGTATPDAAGATNVPVSSPAAPEPQLQRILPRETKVGASRLQPARSMPAAATLYRPGPATGALVYAVSKEAAFDDTMTVLPTGSFVKARVVSGVEANTQEPYPVLLQLEHPFTGPNDSKVNLSNCFMIAKARANLSTERVIMETDTISCVRQNGEYFKSSARGFTAGEDSTFGSTGTFISKQGQVLLAAVLASVAKNAGEAVAAAQQTATVAAGGVGAAVTATNVTGNQAKFIAGRSVVDGAGMIAQWYLDYARQLIPSIAVGSGQTVHVVMLETIRVPTLEE